MRRPDITLKNYLTIEPGTYPCGNNLYFTVAPTGGRSWFFRWERGGIPKKMGFGSAKHVKPAEAKAKAIDALRKIAAGIDPRDERDEQRRDADGSKLFGRFAEECRLDFEKGLRSAGAKYKLNRLVNVTCKPLHSLRLDEIETAHIKAVLKPIWHKQDTARDACQGIKRIFDAAIALDLRKRTNPADWNSRLKPVMPKMTRGRQHLKSLPYADLPALMQKLADEHVHSARALEITILTLARTNEVRLMRWDQLDLDAGLWDLKAEHMGKNDRAKRTPLPRQVVTYLRKAYQDRISEHVFPGRSLRKPMSNKAMLQFIKKLTGDPGLTVHGFRGTFRTWAQEETKFDRETVEHCLHHILGDAAELAYKTGEALRKRRIVLQAFADYATRSGKVVRLIKQAA